MAFEQFLVSTMFLSQGGVKVKVSFQVQTDTTTPLPFHHSEDIDRSQESVQKVATMENPALLPSVQGFLRVQSVPSSHVAPVACKASTEATRLSRMSASYLGGKQSYQPVSHGIPEQIRKHLMHGQDPPLPHRP
jgi:hypothetical protein